MKKLFVLMLLLFSSTVLADEVKVSVKGLVCGFCAQGISKKFKADPAVESIDVSLEKKLVVIGFKKDQNLSNQTIETLLKDSGYTVEKIERVQN